MSAQPVVGSGHTSTDSSPSLVVQSSDAGRRYLCTCWLCLLLIPELETCGGAKQADGVGMWYTFPGPEMLCVDVPRCEA